MLIRPLQSSSSSIESLECTISHYSIVCPPRKIQSIQYISNFLEIPLTFQHMVFLSEALALIEYNQTGWWWTPSNQSSSSSSKHNPTTDWSTAMQHDNHIFVQIEGFLCLHLFSSSLAHLREIFTTWLSGFPGAQMAVLHYNLLNFLLTLLCKTENCASCY